MDIDINLLRAGDIVQHRLNKDWLMFIGRPTGTDKKIVECRTKSFEIKEFYEFELELPSHK